MLNAIVLRNFKSKNKDKYKPGTVVPLNRGYARYLIKQGKVLAATTNNQHIAEKLLLEENKKREEKLIQANIMGEKLKKEKLSFIVTQYNGNGIFFGAIKIHDILNKLHQLSSDYHNIKNNDLTLNSVIKIHGIYFIHIHLYELEVKIPVFVTKSEGELKKMYDEYLNIDKEVKTEEEIKNA